VPCFLSTLWGRDHTPLYEYGCSITNADPLENVAGALIPSLATITFNLMHFFFENYSIVPRPKISESSYDISVGCAFSLIGICVTVGDQRVTIRALIVFVSLILSMMFFNLLAPALLEWSKAFTVWLVNILSFAALAYAIVDADD
jgi:hypothetical protein